MKTCFDPVTIGGIALKNRIIRSATIEYGADSKGRHSKIHRKLYEDLAKGEIGGIITGMISVHPGSQYVNTMVKAYTDEFEDDLRDLRALLDIYGCPLIVQICHCGVKTTMPKVDGDLVGPSEFVLPSGISCRAITREEIGSLVECFAVAAAKCQRAGAAAVQIHAAHGFLLSQFLSPYFNRRDDEYGGNIENRSRFLMEVYQAIRGRVGNNYPIWIKINSQDFSSPGLSFQDSLWVCKELERQGINAIEYSGGINEDKESLCAKGVKKGGEQGFFAPYAQQLQEQVRVPVISVGGYRTPEGINTWLNKSNLEYISLSRPLIVEPSLIRRWKSGDHKESRCISCNKCFGSENGLACQVVTK